MIMTDVRRRIRKVLPETQLSAANGGWTADAEGIMEVFAAAKGIMRASGNMHQWADGYPSLDAVRADMARGGAYVVEDDGHIVGYFAFLPSPEPTYEHIYEGLWLDDVLPYHVIHRIASLPEARGVFHSILDFCLARDVNIRIDTHRDNRIMQHLLEKHGFAYCGIIYLDRPAPTADGSSAQHGDERLAYQLISRRGVVQRIRLWLQSLSFRMGVCVLLACIPFYILSFAQMLLPISAAAKGVLWTILFGLAKTCQYGGLTILGVDGYQRLKRWFTTRGK